MRNALPDVNVWLAMAWRNHAFHGAAKSWFWNFEGGCCFCRVTQMSLLRLMTNRRILGGDVLRQTDAWQVYRRLLADPQVMFREGPAMLEIQWQTLASRPSPSTKRWTDDYLAGFAMASGLRLVSFDRGFSEYQGLDAEILQ